MAAEAQKLINISLTKLAKSRSQRGGVSLHRNLLVATVLRRARFVFMEEAYHMVHRHDLDSEISSNMSEEKEIFHGYHNNSLNFDVYGHIASEVVVDESRDGADSDSRLFAVQEEANKENRISPLPTEQQSAHDELDSRLHDDTPVLREKFEANPTHLAVSRSYEFLSSANFSLSSPSSLKRRRVVVAEWETEEAILSILPKKAKRDEVNDESEASTLLDGIAHSTTDDSEGSVTSMEIDRITSLVSIFSFGGLNGGGNSEMFSGGVVIGSSTDNVGKLTRSVSTPDLCSAQAKEGVGVDVMQRPFLAMTV